MTRFIGFVLIVPLVWEYVTTHYDRTKPLRSLLTSKVVAIMLPSTGLLLYFLLMWVQLGNPLIYFDGQIYWDRHFTRWWILFARESFWGQNPFYHWWFAGTAAVCLSLLLVGVFVRLRTTYLILGLTFGFIYFSSRYVEALPRYFSVVFPLYMILGMIGRQRPRLVLPLLTASVALLTLSVVLFVNGYWFT